MSSPWKKKSRVRIRPRQEAGINIQRRQQTAPTTGEGRQIWIKVGVGLFAVLLIGITIAIFSSPKESSIADTLSTEVVENKDAIIPYLTTQLITDDTLWNVLLTSKIPLQVCNQIYHALASQAPIQKLETTYGAKLNLVYDKARQADSLGRLHFQLLAIEWKGPNKDYALFYDSLQQAFTNEEGYRLQPQFLSSPLQNGYISSPFNRNRKHPVYKDLRPHLGTDFAAAEGSPVLALGSGQIDRLGRDNANGFYVAIRHDETYTTMYLHLNGKAPVGIYKGASVEQGDVIGYVGHTGDASGPHVCLRFKKNGIQVDPFGPDVQIGRANHQAQQRASDDHLQRIKSWTALLGKTD